MATANAVTVLVVRPVQFYEHHILKSETREIIRNCRSAVQNSIILVHAAFRIHFLSRLLLHRKKSGPGILQLGLWPVFNKLEDDNRR